MAEERADPGLTVESPWLDVDVGNLAALIGTADGWWLSGGRALDAWLGRATRAHSDTDIGCFREELPALRSHLRGWALFEAHEGTLTPLSDGRQPRAEVTSLWCHQPSASAWTLQIMLEELRDDCWVYRRDGHVRVQRDAITWLSDAGCAVYRPEIQLLYKARAPRQKDRADFDLVAPALDDGARTWLIEALETAHPDADWLPPLRTMGVG